MNGAFKGLDQSDVYRTSYTSKKLWEAIGSGSFENLGISKLEVAPGSPIYESYRSSYYEGSIPNSGSFSGSYDLNLQSTLTLQGGRRLPETIVAYKIPRDCFGETIEPNSFWLEGETFTLQDREGLLLLNTAPVSVGKDFVLEEDSETSTARLLHTFSVVAGQNYVLTFEMPGGGNWDNLDSVDSCILEGTGIRYTAKEVAEMVEDGMIHIPFIPEQPQITVIWLEGESRVGGDLNIILERPELEKPLVAGDIIYDRGLILLHGNLINPVDCDLYWTSNLTINTWNVRCRVRDLEYNYSYNPSIGGKNADIMGTPEFTPYVSTVGLYNRTGELMAVAKLSKPVKKNDNIDMTFKVNIDIS